MRKVFVVAPLSGCCHSIHVRDGREMADLLAHQTISGVRTHIPKTHAEITRPVRSALDAGVVDLVGTDRPKQFMVQGQNVMQSENAIGSAAIKVRVVDPTWLRGEPPT